MIHLLYGLISMIVVFGPADVAPTEKETASEQPAEQNRVSDPVMDARRFFELLVERYRNLTSYSDMSRIVQVIQHAGEGEPRRVETEMSSEVADGLLRTETVFEQIRRTFGLNLPLPKAEPVERAELHYQLWMLPHLTLKFSDDPLRQFREGVNGGFTATELTPVTVDNRPLVHLELRSGDGPGGEVDATFDLYVDPDSMLIERIQGQQRLPDGGNYETTVEITPHRHESDHATGRPAYHGWPIRTPDSETEREGQTSSADVKDVPSDEPADQPADPYPYPYPSPPPAPADDPDPSPKPDDQPESSDGPDSPPQPEPEPRPASASGDDSEREPESGSEPEPVPQPVSGVPDGGHGHAGF